jgi:hypothetical protein
VELLQNEVNDGRAILADFEPLNCGHRRTAAMHTGADFRVGDLDRYWEVALVFRHSKFDWLNMTWLQLG